VRVGQAGEHLGMHCSCGLPVNALTSCSVMGRKGMRCADRARDSRRRAADARVHKRAVQVEYAASITGPGLTGALARLLSSDTASLSVIQEDSSMRTL